MCKSLHSPHLHIPLASAQAILPSSPSFLPSTPRTPEPLSSPPRIPSSQFLLSSVPHPRQSLQPISIRSAVPSRRTIHLLFLRPLPLPQLSPPPSPPCWLKPRLSTRSLSTRACPAVRMSAAAAAAASGAVPAPVGDQLITPPASSWDPSPVDDAEQALLAALAPGLEYEKRSVPVGRGAFMNSISAGAPGLPHLVLAHGWGAGAALFAKNLPDLAANYRVHVIDWLGFGASARVPHSTEFSPEEAEDFFLDALEDWVEHMRRLEPSFERFSFVGHSMGAFLAVGYALRRPRDVVNLVLASPVGVPRAPENKYPPATAPLKKRLLFWLVFTLWERHWTPQVLVRYAPTGDIGRTIAGWAMAPRFPAKEEATRSALVEYFYQMCVAPPSAEHTLTTILESGAYARRPLVDKLPRVEMPVAFLYGDRDWMDRSGGEAVRKKMAVPTELEVVENAGHHLYYDNPEAFARCVNEACGAAWEREQDSA